MVEDQEANFWRSSLKAISRDDRSFDLPCASMAVSSAD